MATFYSDVFSSDPSTFTKQDRRAGALTAGAVLYKRAYLTIPDTANGDVIRLCKVHSSDRIHKLVMSSGDSGTAGTIDLGLYDLPDDPDGSGIGSAVDDNLFASAIDVNTAALSQVDQFDEAALDDFDRGKQVWELLGLSSDPQKEYELCATMDAGSTQAFEFLLEVEWSPGSAS